MTPWRSRPYLDLSYVEGKTCVRCGKPGCEPCHYSGQYSDRLGKGGAQKSFDAAVADLCRECHVYFDLYHAGNDDVRAASFLMLVLATLHRNLQEGHCEIVVHTFLEWREPTWAEPTQRSCTMAGCNGQCGICAPKRRKKSRCTASTKTVPRRFA